MIYKYIPDYILIQHGYQAVKDTCTIFYITHNITIYLVD